MATPDGIRAAIRMIAADNPHIKIPPETPDFWYAKFLATEDDVLLSAVDTWTSSGSPYWPRSSQIMEIVGAIETERLARKPDGLRRIADDLELRAFAGDFDTDEWQALIDAFLVSKRLCGAAQLRRKMTCLAALTGAG